MRFIFLLLIACLISIVLIAPVDAARSDIPQRNSSLSGADEFVGPFASWANLKRDYGAIGDGKADDTAALQKALDTLKQPNKPRVLYLPAGTYRITSGLTMSSAIHVSILGEDPATTTIRWDGPAGGAMLYCNGVSYSRFGRITWDGASKALTAVDHGWDGKVPYANTDGEHADEVFKDVGFGIRGGSHGFMDAECAVLRCRFERCSKAGISIENFNALDWFIWYSSFQDCHFGVTNTYGAGNFHVYESLFQRSTEADVAMANCEYFSLRHNTSIGSKAFFQGGWNGCAGLVTLQGNTVLDPTGPTAIQVGNLGPLVFVDNVIRSRAPQGKDEHVVRLSIAGTALAVGNTFTVANAIEVANPKPGEQVLSLENKVVAPTVIKTVVPTLPATPPNQQRRVFEVAAGADATAIQNAIDAATKLRGQQPIVHLPVGEYRIDKTLVIPANTPIQLVGDGFETQLTWTGKPSTPEAATVLRLAGPSRAVLREMSIVGAGQATGVVVENCDQSGARIFMEQGNAQGGPGTGLLADSLDNADVSLHDFYHSGCKEVGVKAIGGPGMAAGRNVAGRVTIFGGASSNNTVSYDVVNGGRILAEDIWYEGAPPRFIHFTPASSGTFTLNGATTATGRPGPDAPVADPNFAAIETDDFRGNLTLLNVIVGTNIVVGGAGQKTNVFCMAHGNEGYFSNRSPQAQAVLYGSTKYTAGGGATTTPNVGNPDPNFIRTMLAQLRNERPRLLTNLKGGVTDVRIFRVNVSNCLTDFHLKAK